MAFGFIMGRAPFNIIFKLFQAYSTDIPVVSNFRFILWT